MAPVVEPKGHVAVLLHFEHHNVSQGMNDPGPYVNTVARLWRKAGELLVHGSVHDGLPHSLRRYGGLQARIDAGLGPGLQDYPCFGLSGISRRNEVPVRIRWVHLHGETPPHVEKLQQQRKTTELSVQLTQQLLRGLLQHSRYGLSFEDSIRNQAGMIIPIA